MSGSQQYSSVGSARAEVSHARQPKTPCLSGIGLKGIADEFGLAAPLRFGHLAQRQHDIGIEVEFNALVNALRPLISCVRSLAALVSFARTAANYSGTGLGGRNPAAIGLEASPLESAANLRRRLAGARDPAERRSH